ncbi:hypothetical protein K1Y78_37365 [Streptomyces sp. tea 10]|nr:hypothetical protein [Streptomyces sp. tea 10]
MRGQLMLEAVPAHWSDADAADVLAPLCEVIGKDLDRGLAGRRPALSGWLG